MRSRRPSPLAISRLDSCLKPILLLMVLLVLGVGLVEAPGAPSLTKIDRLAMDQRHVSNDRHTDSNRAATDLSMGDLAGKSLMKISAPDVLKDDVEAADSNSVQTHVRVKRISDTLDPPSVKLSSKPPSIPAHPLIDQHRTTSRRAKKFSLEETNPADENESDYSNAYVDVDAEVPGDFLNDELTRKRNYLEDVYPEVTDPPVGTEVPQDSSTLFNVDDDGKSRKKRDRGDEEIDDADADANCVDGDQGLDYYYEDETLSERVNCRGEKRSRGSVSPQAENRYDQGQRIEKRSGSHQKSAANKKTQHPKPPQINVQFTLSQEPKVSRHSTSQQTSSSKNNGKSHVSSAKISKDSHRKSQNHRMKGKVKTKKITVPTKKSKSKSQSKLSKASPANSAALRKGKPGVKHSEKSRSRDKSAKNVKKKVSKTVRMNITSSGLRNNEYNGESESEAAIAEGINGDRYKRNKNLAVNSISDLRSIKDLQNYQTAQKPMENKEISDPTADRHTNALQGQIISDNASASKSLVEMKDLLSRLVAKVEDLHTLMSQMKGQRAAEQFQPSTGLQRRRAWRRINVNNRAGERAPSASLVSAR